MLEAILASSALGSLFGLIGGAIDKYQERKLNEMKFKHELAMREVDAKILAQEWAARTKVAEVESAGREAVEDSKAFAESFRTEPQRYSEGVTPTAAQGWLLVILDFVRGVTRPGLTLYLCALTTLVYWEARRLMGPGMTPEMAIGVLGQIISTILFLSTTCVTWWFGTRNKSRS